MYMWKSRPLVLKKKPYDVVLLIKSKINNPKNNNVLLGIEDTTTQIADVNDNIILANASISHLYLGLIKDNSCHA